jgi:hypothetical protein
MKAAIFLSAVGSTGASDAQVMDGWCAGRAAPARATIYVYGALPVLTSFTCAIEGRLTPSSPWFALHTEVQSNINGLHDISFDVVPTPFMRANIMALAGSAKYITVQLTER